MRAAERDLLGSFIRECDGADAVRIEAVHSDEVIDSGDETERLPGAGSGHDEHGAQWRLNSQALLRKGIERGHAYSLVGRVRFVYGKACTHLYIRPSL